MGRVALLSPVKLDLCVLGVILGVANAVAFGAFLFLPLSETARYTLPGLILAGTMVVGLLCRLWRLNRDNHRLVRAHDLESAAARHDPLTRLPNRRSFEEHLQDVVGRAAAVSGEFAVLTLDLDRFKTINDSLGHEAGDELLAAAAGRMRGCLRESDLLARIGGDEFTIILEGREVEGRVRLAGGRIIAALQKPFALSGRTVHIGASIGACVASGRVPSGTTLVKQADAALYDAKRDGRSTIRVRRWSREMARPAPGGAEPLCTVS